VTCLLCKNKDLITVLSLGDYFPQNTIKTYNKMGLDVAICNFCTTVQIPKRFGKEINFPPEYPFRSRMTKALISNFVDLSEKLEKVLPGGSRILEIGSNDGSLLRLLEQKDFEVFGVEPTHAARESETKNPVVIGFFEDVSFEESFDCIVLTNTFAHLDSPVFVLRKLRELLTPNGLVIIEIVDLDQMLKMNEFDKFTHEHGIYFNQMTLNNLMSSEGFSEVSFERITTHGGSLRAMFRYTGVVIPFKKHNSQQLIEEFSILRKRMLDLGVELGNILSKFRSEGSPIFLAGATTRGEILVNALGLDKEIFQAVLENPKSKRVGTLMANLDLEVVKDESISTCDSPTVLILAWHVYKEVSQSLKEVNPFTRCIIPLPEIRIL